VNRDESVFSADCLAHFPTGLSCLELGQLGKTTRKRASHVANPHDGCRSLLCHGLFHFLGGALRTHSDCRRVHSLWPGRVILHTNWVSNRIARASGCSIRKGKGAEICCGDLNCEPLDLVCGCDGSVAFTELQRKFSWVLRNGALSECGLNRISAIFEEPRLTIWVHLGPLLPRQDDFRRPSL
jgi:hypothetical protein